MKTIILYSIGAAVALASTATVQARHHVKDTRRDEIIYPDHDDNWHHDHKDRSKTIYVIERDRPVQRVVYVDTGGRYYRYISGQRVYVTERHYDSFPSRYYYPDGRRRVGFSIHF